ncbi:hypothetical protein MRX96_000029 [Rhipicephalus microplus]
MSTGRHCDSPVSAYNIDGNRDVTSSHKGGGRPPRITEQPVDVVVRKHEPVTLRCGTDGEPPPRIAWFHDGKSVRDSATRMVLPEGQLFFLQVQHSRREQDTGLYWCTATNPLGTARSRNASVELAGVPGGMEATWLGSKALVPFDQVTHLKDHVL